MVEVEDGTQLKLVVENKEKGEGHVLYLHLYSMGDCWEIENVLRGNHKVIPSGQWGSMITMIIPPEKREKGQYQCEDIIKVFLTTQLTLFTLLELLELATLAS